MLIVGVNGSPAKNGNTAYLLTRGLEQAAGLGAKTELIHVMDALADFKVPFCTACSTPCKADCTKDTAMEKALDLLRRADAVLVGSPVYFGTLTGQLKAFWDKARVLRSEKALLNTVGASVAVGATRFGGQEQTLRAIDEIMLIQGMTLVGAGHSEHDCGHHGVAGQKPVQEDKFACERIIILAKRMVEVARVTATLRN